MFDERPDIQERLEGELVAWMTTVDSAGQPQTSPVWFLVEDEVIVYKKDLNIGIAVAPVCQGGVSR